jgi:phage gp36-like protein
MPRYATVDDLDVSGIPKSAFGHLSPSIQIQAILDNASAFADTFIGCKYTLPLAGPTSTPPVPYDPALVDAVCQIAVYRAMRLRGYKPDAPGDVSFRMGFEDAYAWLTRVANGQARLAVVQANPESLQPNVSTSEPRGYGYIGGNGIGGINGGF